LPLLPALVAVPLQRCRSRRHGGLRATVRRLYPLGGEGYTRARGSAKLFAMHKKNKPGNRQGHA
jgi:hypothetical protein